MADKCYAPVFDRTRNILGCLYLALIFIIVIMLLILSLIWLTAEGRCLIKQYYFRIAHCGQGNSDPNRMI